MTQILESIPTIYDRPLPSCLSLITAPHPILRVLCQEVKVYDTWLLEVVDRMKELMIQHKGAGLAAPQVGLPIRLFIATDTGRASDIKVYVNPWLTDMKGLKEGEEGCLSLPGVKRNVWRAKAVRIRAFDECGRFFVENWKNYGARILQHEYDHLQGKLISDRANEHERVTHAGSNN